MTGINPWNSNIIDFPDQRYSKYKITADKFRIIQLGLCTWKKVLTDNSDFHYIARPYNIFVFPEDFSGNALINCETAAIIFNREHKMDFNKWIYKGIPYINAKQEATLIDSLNDGNVNLYNPSDKTKFKNVYLHKEEDKLKYEEFCKIFSEFLYSEQKTYFFEKYPKFFIYYILNNTPENIRKRIHFSFETLEGKPVLMISKLDDEEKKIKMEIEIGEKLKEIDRKKGVRKIFEAIVKKKSLFVGHNCNLDLMFTISHFGDPLPQNLKDFKETLKKYFSTVYDTKYVFQNFCEEYKDEIKIDLKTSHLENVYTTLKGLYADKIKIFLHDDAKEIYSENSGVYHEAAYDAYVTGCSFVWMGETLKEKLTPHANKLFLMRSIYQCFNITGDDTYVLPESMAYCLKAIKQISDIDLKSLLEEKFFERIKKIYNLDLHNSILILVNLETSELIGEFELIMNKFPETFEFYHFYKFKQILKDDEDKKGDNKKGGNKNNKNTSNV